MLDLRVFWCETAVAFSTEYDYTNEGYLDALLRQYRDACLMLPKLDDTLLDIYVERLADVRDDAEMGNCVQEEMSNRLGDALKNLPVTGEAHVPQLGED